MRPSQYNRSFTITRDLPYNVREAASKGTHPSAGTLLTGRVVWLDHQLDQDQRANDVQAFVDGVGLITIDAASLSAVH